VKKNEINIHNGKLFTGNEEIPLEFPVAQAIRFRDIIILLFDPDSYTEKFGQFRNLIAVEPSGKMVWKGELPTTMSGDRYYQATFGDSIVADSVFSYRCEIDKATGKIVRKEFYK
jgi:hypothetical protein